MAQKGFKGISFPFRFNGRGGVATSSTSSEDFSHIKEGLQQVIGTIMGERIYELEFGSEVNKFNFQNQDDPVELSRLRFYVEEAVSKWDDRIELLDVIVTPISDDSNGTYTIVDVDFHVTKYMKDDSVRVTIAR